MTTRPKIPLHLRDKGVYIAGRPGYGKTTLMMTHMRQDLLHGNGLCFVDPNGDAVDEMLPWVPENRVDDCILFDTRFPRAIDFLSYRDSTERDNLLNDLANLFDLETAKKSKPLIIRLLATLLDARERGADITFFDIANFITSKDRRQAILDHVPERKELYRNIKETDYDTILTRLIPVQESKTLCAIFSGKHAVNIYDLIQQKKIFLVRMNFSPNDHFIGSLIITKIQQMAMRRPKSERVPYYLYIDEFENLQGAPYKEILTQGRKFQLCVTLANQVIGTMDDAVRRYILGTVSTFIILHIQDEDCHYFKSIVPIGDDGRCDPSFLAHLPAHRALYKIGDEPPLIHATPKPPPPLKPVQLEIAETIINRAKRMSPSEIPANPYSEGNGDTENHPAAPISEDPKTLLSDRPKKRRP